MYGWAHFNAQCLTYKFIQGLLQHCGIGTKHKAIASDPICMLNSGANNCAVYLCFLFCFIRGYATCLGCIYHMALWIWCSNEEKKRENIIPSCQHLLIYMQTRRGKKGTCDPSCVNRFMCFSLNVRAAPFLHILYEQARK